MNNISPEDLSLFKTITREDENVAKVYLLRYPDVNTALSNYFSAQEVVASQAASPLPNNPSAPSSNQNSISQPPKYFQNDEMAQDDASTARRGDTSSRKTRATRTFQDMSSISKDSIVIEEDSLLGDDFKIGKALDSELEKEAKKELKEINELLDSEEEKEEPRRATVVDNNVAQFMAVTGVDEKVATEYLARYKNPDIALNEYFRKEAGEASAEENDSPVYNVTPMSFNSNNFPKKMAAPVRAKIACMKPRSKAQKNKEERLPLKLRGSYEEYVKKYVGVNMLENEGKEWPKFLGSLLVECRVTSNDNLMKMKVGHDVRFEPEDIEYTSTTITTKKKTEEPGTIKETVGKNWYIKGSSLLVRCIWNGKHVGYLNCEYEEAFVFLLTKKYVFVEGIIVDSPNNGKPDDFSFGNSDYKGLSSFNKIKVQLDVFLTEEVIKNPLNVVQIPGRKRGGKAAKGKDEIESKESQQMYQMLRLAKESFVKVFNMLKMKVTIPTIVQVRQRFDPFQRIKREKYGFRARGRQRYFLGSWGAPAEVVTNDFPQYYSSQKKKDTIMRSQTVGVTSHKEERKVNNLSLSGEEDDEDFSMTESDSDIDSFSSNDDYEDENLERQVRHLNRLSQNQNSIRRGTTEQAENDKNKPNQDLLNTNQISSYYTASEAPSTLKSTLHVYQKQALSWMKHREGLLDKDELFAQKLEEQRVLSDLFQEMELINGSKLYFNPFNGEMSVELPTVKACKGGILADEMGLGKTVMTIALLHANKRDNRQAPANNNELIDEEDDDDNNKEDDVIKINPRAAKKRIRKTKTKQIREGSDSEEDDDGSGDEYLPSKEKKKATLNDFFKIRKSKTSIINGKREADEDSDFDDEEDKAAKTKKKRKGEDKTVELPRTESYSCNPADSDAEEIVAPSKKAPKKRAIKKTPEKGKTDKATTKPKATKAKKATKTTRKLAGTLIVVPLTVLSQWELEIKKHSNPNTLSVLQYYGGSRRSHNLQEYDVVLTTYGLLESEYKNHQKKTGSQSSQLFECEWFRVILDEAHYIKARQTKTSKAACALTADYRWCLTGTPLQNKLDDMFSLLQFLKMDTWGEYFWWNTYINKYISHEEASNLIRGILKPVILRRTKKSTYLDGKNILELPGKEINTCFVKLSNEERAVYNCFFNGSRQQFNDMVKGGTLTYEYAHVFELMIRLRQVCDHPSLVFSKDDLKDNGSIENAVYKFLEKRLQNLGNTDKKEKKGKMEEENSMMGSEFIQKTMERLKNKELEPCCICLEEITDPAIANCGHIFCRECLGLCLQASGKCPLCQTQISKKDVMSISLEDTEKCRDLLDVKCNTFKKSSKLIAILEAVHEVAKKKQKVVIFSQFITMLNLIERFLNDEKVAYKRLDGSSSMVNRQKSIDEFNKDKGITVFLISLKAGAIGLNLTVATNVFLVDPWWNPAVEDQAIERVHRIGQENNVNVIRFVCEKTIEERIQQLNAQKKKMINEILHFNPQEQKKQNIENMIYVMRGFDDE